MSRTALAFFFVLALALSCGLAFMERRIEPCTHGGPCHCPAPLKLHQWEEECLLGERFGTTHPVRWNHRLGRFEEVLNETCERLQE